MKKQSFSIVSKMNQPNLTYYMEHSYITLYIYISISNTPTIVLVIYLYLKSRRIFHLNLMKELLIFHQLRFLSLLMRTNHNVKIPCSSGNCHFYLLVLDFGFAPT
jgi:hypothetical protein